MKSICLLSFLLLFFICALSGPNSHATPDHPDNQAPVCRMNLVCGSGTMKQKEFETRKEVRVEERGNLENTGGNGEDAYVSTSLSEDAIHRDYAVSDPPPITRRPSKEPVHYRIFRTPPISSPIP